MEVHLLPRDKESTLPKGTSGQVSVSGPRGKPTQGLLRPRMRSGAAGAVWTAVAVAVAADAADCQGLELRIIAGQAGGGSVALPGGRVIEPLNGGGGCVLRLPLKLMVITTPTVSPGRKGQRA